MLKLFKLNIVLFVIVLMIIVIRAQEEECPKNQQFTNCGSACPLKCNDDFLKPCTLQCIIGCQCKPGFLLNDDNQCVSPDEC